MEPHGVVERSQRKRYLPVDDFVDEESSKFNKVP
jgi:hypothetical protein